MVTTIFNEVIAGLTGCRFVSSDSGQPSRRVIATPFVGTRSRGGNTERGIGVEYWSSLASHEGVHNIFVAMDTKNPKEYLRALEILVHMERIDPDILVGCAQASKKQATATDTQFIELRKYQPLQLEKILAKRDIVFGNPCDQNALRAIIDGFQNCGMPVNNPFTEAIKKEATPSWEMFPRATVAEMSLAI